MLSLMMPEFPLADSVSSPMLATCHSVTAYCDSWISHNDCCEKGLLSFCDCHNITYSFGLNTEQLWLFQTLSVVRMIYYSCSPFDRWFSLSSISDVKMTGDTFDLFSQGIYFLYGSDSHLTLTAPVGNTELSNTIRCIQTSTSSPHSRTLCRR